MEIVEADLGRYEHREDVLRLVETFAREAPAGRGGLAEDARRDLIPALRDFPGTRAFLAYVEGEAAGIALCFTGFSTFAARPLLNVHDLAVLEAYRGRGIGRALLARVEDCARELGCAKVTLEVDTENERAKGLYASRGFRRAQEFWVKEIRRASG